MSSGDPFQQVAGARAAWRDLSARGLLRAIGSDRTRFLNGMVTQDVAALGPGQGIPALLLDRKGKILSELEIWVDPEAIWMDVSPGRAPVVREVFEKHLIADDVSVEVRGRELSQLSFEGPAARDVARSLGAPELEPGTHRPSRAGEDEILWRAGGSLDRERGVRAIAAPGVLERMASRSGVGELSEAAAEILRVEAFRPAWGLDFDETHFPAEARLEGAISFTKGCYIGQEFVARIRSRGAVNRLLVKLSCAAEPVRGAPISAEGRRIGEVTSAVVSPLSGPLALGYVKRERAAPGTELEVAGTPARVVGPPLEEG